MMVLPARGVEVGNYEQFLAELTHMAKQHRKMKEVEVSAAAA
jgi:hypothetical protein